MIVGTRAVQQSILDSYPDEDIQVILIWIRMYEVDTIEASQLAANQFGTDTRVIHFYDPGQLLGRTIAERFGAEAGKVAWDIYLLHRTRAAQLAAVARQRCTERSNKIV